MKILRFGSLQFLLFQILSKSVLSRFRISQHSPLRKLQSLSAKFGLGAGVLLLFGQPSFATEFRSYASPEASFSVKLDPDLYESSKPVKTHDVEVFFKSATRKGYNAGVTVDKVKINSLTDYLSPKQLANKVQDVEKSKEGVFDVNILQANEATPAYETAPSYELEYIVDSTRGKNHFLVKTTIVNKKLYVFTVQGPDDIYKSELSEPALEMINSFYIKPKLLSEN